ncbi:MAG TPA: N-acetylmuramoyl-L-alanine amidase [Opitutaceae bacterium]|jgi:AmpD protein
MAFREIECLSPNRDPGRHERLGVLYHHSEHGFAETIARLLDPASRVSYHCLIDRDGTRCTLVPDSDVAWHAGASHFLGRDRCNDFLLGVAFAGDSDREPLSEAQIASALDWLDGRWTPLGLTLDRLADHRQVSPGRKRDLNPTQWGRLRASVAARFHVEIGPPTPQKKPLESE